MADIFMEYSKDDIDQKFSSLATPENISNINSQLATIMYLMSSYPIQTPETNDLARIKRAISALSSVGGGTLRFERGATYNIPVLSETDTITVPSNITLDFNNAILNVGQGQNGPTYWFTFYINGAANVALKRGNFIWQGTYNTTNNPVTQYGISFDNQHSFNTIIALNGSHQNVTIEDMTVYGASDSNLYEAFIRSFSSAGYNLKIKNIDASHYCNLISDGIRYATIENIRGTKRHNLSSNVYGPSHMIYAGLDHCDVKNIYEYGTHLDNTNYDLGATVQLTDFVSSRLEKVLTTMQDAGAVVLKATADSSYINDVVCMPQSWDSNISKSIFMIGIITNQSSVKRLHIDNVFCDVSNFNVTGVWLGGNDITAKNIEVEISNTTVTQTVPPLCLVTGNNAIIDAKVKNNSSNTSPLGFISGTTKSRITLTKLGLFSQVIYYTHPTLNTNWGVSTNNRVEIKELDYTETDVTVSYVNNNERDSNVFVNEDPYVGATKFYTVTGSNVTSLALTVPIDMPQYSVSSYVSQTMTYEILVSVQGYQMNNVLVRKYLCLVTSGSSLTNQIVLQPMITSDLVVGTAITGLTSAVNGTNKQITFTGSASSGVIAQVTAKIKLVDKQIWRG